MLLQKRQQGPRPSRIVLHKIVRLFHIQSQMIELQSRKSLLFGRRLLRGTPSATAVTETKFPISLADGKRSIDGMGNKGVPFGRTLIGEYREETKTILSALLLRLLSTDRLESRIKIRVTNQMLGLGFGSNLTGPADDEGDSMPSFKNISLVASVDTAWMMVMLCQEWKVGLG